LKKAALITGSSRGIGKAIALALAESMPVVINYKGNADAAREVGAAVVEKGGEMILVQADVSNYEQVQQLFSITADAGYWIHTLVNNAGIARDQVVALMTIEAWHQVIDCNLNGAFYCIREAMPSMVARRSGSIINISSTSGLHGREGQANYSSAKAGLVGLTKSLARELGRYNIRVNCVAPGFIETDMVTASMAEEVTGKSVEQAKRGYLPLRRLGRPEEVAAVVQFLASGKASYMTGQTLEVDGGLSI